MFQRGQYLLVIFIIWEYKSWVIVTLEPPVARIKRVPEGRTISDVEYGSGSASHRMRIHITETNHTGYDCNVQCMVTAIPSWKH